MSTLGKLAKAKLVCLILMNVEQHRATDILKHYRDGNNNSNEHNPDVFTLCKLCRPIGNV